MTKIFDKFTALLRAGLWNAPDKLTGFGTLTDHEWQRVMGAAGRCGTVGLVLDGISLLPAESRPSRALLMKWALELTRIVASHRKHNATIASISRLMQSLDCPFVLLKGQTNAVNFVRPESRRCGDIDVYIGPERLDALLDALLERGITYEEEINDNEKHAVIYFNDIGIELHRFSALMFTPKANRFYQKWWADAVAGECDAIYVDENGQLSADAFDSAERVAVAPPTHNTFFLFNHAFHHFMGQAVQFRQFCDLARALYVNVDRIDKNELARALQATGLMEAWQAFGLVLNKYFGLDSKYIPFFDASLEKKADKIMERLRREVIFAKPRRWKRPKNFIGSKIYSYTNYLRDFWPLMKIFPGLSVQHMCYSTVLGFAVLGKKRNRNDAAKNYEARRQKEAKS